MAEQNPPVKHQPVPPEIRPQVQAIAQKLGEQMPPGWVFGLFTWHSEDHVMLWISNVERKDMLEALQAWMREEGS